MQQVLTYPFLRVHLHGGTSIKAIETQWLGFANSADFRRSVAEALVLGQTHRVKGWIADDRLLGAMRPKDLEWTYENVLLPLNRIGLQRFALLDSTDLLNRLTIDRMYTQAKPAVDFEIRHFDDIVAARAWVLNL